jgi:hypothetical protein
MTLQPIDQLVVWTTRAEHESGLEWPRNRIIALAEERDATGTEPVRA